MWAAVAAVAVALLSLSTSAGVTHLRLDETSGEILPFAGNYWESLSDAFPAVPSRRQSASESAQPQAGGGKVDLDVAFMALVRRQKGVRRVVYDSGMPAAPEDLLDAPQTAVAAEQADTGTAAPEAADATCTDPTTCGASSSVASVDGTAQKETGIRPFDKDNNYGLPPDLPIQEILESLRKKQLQEPPPSKLPPGLTCGSFIRKSMFDGLETIRNRENIVGINEEPSALIMSQHTKAAEMMPNQVDKDVAYLNDVAQLHRTVGESRLAIECFRKALLLGPKDQLILLNLGDLLYNLRKYEDAIAVFHYSLQCPGVSYHNFFQIGKTLQAMASFPAAMEAFEACLSKNPSFFPCQKQLATCRLLQKESRSQSNIAVTIGLISVCILVTLGVVYYGLAGTSSGDPVHASPRKTSRQGNGAARLRHNKR